MSIDKKLITYADSLAWKYPEDLQSIISDFYEAICGNTMIGFSLRSCHNHDSSNGKCNPSCASFYPLQTCADIYGLVTVVCASIEASLNQSFFEHITSPNQEYNGPQIFLKTPSRYNKYLRLAVALWIMEKGQPGSQKYCLQ